MVEDGSPSGVFRSLLSASMKRRKTAQSKSLLTAGGGGVGSIGNLRAISPYTSKEQQDASATGAAGLLQQLQLLQQQ